MPPTPAAESARATAQRALRARVRTALVSELSGRTGNTNGATTILLGFSGGLDSKVLLHLLADVVRGPDSDSLALAEPPLLAVHLDHALHPDSEEHARAAERIAASLQVPFITERRDVKARAEREGRSLEEAGRLERLDFFAEVARTRNLKGGKFIVTLAHTLTDQAETLLLRLARGSGGLGLGAMAPSREDERGFRILRPLLDVSRSELEALASSEDWNHLEDPTNNDPRFTRNRIRNEVFPLLREAVHPEIEAALGRAAELLRADEASLGTLAARRFAEVATVESGEDGTAVRLPWAALPGDDPGLERRLIREALRRVRGRLQRVGFVHVEAVRGLAQTGQGGASLDLPGARVRLQGGVLIFTAAPEAAKTPEPGASSGVLPQEEC